MPSSARAGLRLVGALLAVLGPPVIIRRLLAHHQIDLTTVAGALCVYLLAGILFAYIFAAVGDIGGDPFFVQQTTANGVDFVYFSFVTLATLGYGDLTTRGDLGRMLSVTEAILGQLYLVSAVALLVANLGRTRTVAAPTRPPGSRVAPHESRARRQSEPKSPGPASLSPRGMLPLDMSVMVYERPARYPAHISAPRPTTPRCGDRAVTRRPMRSHPVTGRPHMLRLQAPLPDDYTLATDDELVARIAAAKASAR